MKNLIVLGFVLLIAVIPASAGVVKSKITLDYNESGHLITTDVTGPLAGRVTHVKYRMHYRDGRNRLRWSKWETRKSQGNAAYTPPARVGTVYAMVYVGKMCVKGKLGRCAKFLKELGTLGEPEPIIVRKKRVVKKAAPAPAPVAPTGPTQPQQATPPVDTKGCDNCSIVAMKTADDAKKLAQQALDKVNDLGGKVTKNTQDIDAMKKNSGIVTVKDPNATDEAACKKLGGTWSQGACILVKQESRFQFVPSFGFTGLWPSGGKSNYGLLFEAELRFWGTESFASKLSTGTGFGFQDGASLNWTVAGGVEYYMDERKRFGLGFSMRYWSYDLSSSLKARRGRALTFMPGFFWQVHRNVRIGLEPGAGMHFLNGSIMPAFALNAMIGFSIPGK